MFKVDKVSELIPVKDISVERDTFILSCLYVLGLSNILFTWCILIFFVSVIKSKLLMIIFVLIFLHNITLIWVIYISLRGCCGRHRMVVGFTFSYLCNQCLSPLMLWVRISIRARCTTLCNKFCQWLFSGSSSFLHQ